jgi:hypothetical protein
VKGILEQGDTAAGGIVAAELAQAEDEEERIYATWLRVWFDLDADESLGATWAPLGEGQARWAALVARAHGAMRLVEKLEQRLLAIAHPGRQE